MTTGDLKYVPLGAGITLRKALLAIIVLVMFGIQALSPLPPNIINQPWVVPVASLPAGADLPKYERFVSGSWAYIVPKINRRPLLAAGPPPKPMPSGKPMLGYSIRRLSVLGMPFFAWKELGFAMVQEHHSRFNVVPLDEGYLNTLARETGTKGKRLEAGYVFPFWLYMWGWLPVIGLLVVAWLERRAWLAHRDALGLI